MKPRARLHLLLLSLAALVLLPLIANSQQPAEPPVPDWIKNINPADYMLVQADLPAGLTIHGELQAEAEGQAVSMTIDGRVQQAHVFTLHGTEGIDCPRPDGKGTHVFSLIISVYETPEIAIQECERRFGEPNWPGDNNEINDPRLTGKGGMVGGSGGVAIIRYQNCVCHILTSGVMDGSTDPQLIEVCRRWIGKVAKTKLLGKIDLHIEPDWIVLTQAQNNNFMATEVAADKQCVVIQVENKDAKEIAKNVMVQLSTLMPGQEKAQVLGDPVPVGDINPAQKKVVSTFWDLDGRNVEGGVLYAQVYIPGEDDAKDEDNIAGIQCNIYYAHNGNRAFSWVDDPYRFVNYTFKDREMEEMVEGLLATIVGNINAEEQMAAIMQRLFFPQTYTALKDYFTTSMEQGGGGHCYGMSVTTALYFEDASLKPVPKRTCDMALEEASTNIAIYHRAQMVPVVRAILTGGKFAQRTFTPAATHQAIKDSLSGARQCVVIEFFGTINGAGAGHAVLGYKLVEVEGREPVVYIYDPNYPVANAQPPKAMPQITLKPGEGNWSNPAYMGYMWANSNDISARRPHRTIPLDTVNAIVPDLKKKLYEMIAAMKTADKFMAVFRCPVDAYFTDSQGRKTGTVNGKPVNEIPGSEIRSQGEVEVYVLPAGEQYSVSMQGSGNGKMGIDVISAASATKANLVSFNDIPIQKGTKATVEVLPGAKIQAVQAGGKTYQPKVVGSMEGDRAEWQTNPAAPTAPETPSQPTGSQVVICRNVTNDQPEGVSDSFQEISKIFAYMTYRNLPQDTKLHIVWKRNGEDYRKGDGTAGGTGAVWFAVSTSAPGGLPSGSYEVAIFADREALGRGKFTIEQQKATPPTQPDSSANPSSGPVTICERVVDGTPQGATTHFESASDVACLMNFENLPENTTVVCVWKKEGVQLIQSERQCSGTGWVSFSISTTSAGGFGAGLYSVTLSANGRELGNATFRVGN